MIHNKIASKHKKTRFVDKGLGYTKRQLWKGILEEDTIGRDEHLLVLGTQTRAPPQATTRLFPCSNTPVKLDQA
jgi:hypothetical protein